VKICFWCNVLRVTRCLLPVNKIICLGHRRCGACSRQVGSPLGGLEGVLSQRIELWGRRTTTTVEIQAEKDRTAMDRRDRRNSLLRSE
jgi:carbonic anhydrase